MQEKSRDWQAIRQIVLKRDGNGCVECGVSAADSGLDVHHLIPRFLAGQDLPENLITLCDGCHAARHPGLLGGLARRQIEKWAIRLAKVFDTRNELRSLDEGLGEAIRLFGLRSLTNTQLTAVLAALRGESVLLVSPTGSGKSVCFQIPAVLKRGTSFVFSPLKALMADQVSALLQRKVPAVFINSDLSKVEKDFRYELLLNGAIKLLYLAPERLDPVLVKKAEVEFLESIRPPLMVVDEAHCVDRWGQDFRPSYGRLGEKRAVIGSPPVLAFTATAGVAAQDRILESLRAPEARRILVDVDRPNIALYRFDSSSVPARADFIAQVIKKLPKGRVMVFVPTKKIGIWLQDELSGRLNCDVPFFHGTLELKDKEGILGRFTGRLKPDARAVICTNAFGMGLDVADVRVVIHWQHPASPEDYLQEFGRAGRDGEQALAVLLSGQGPDKEIGLLQFMVTKMLEKLAIDPGQVGKLKQIRFSEIASMAALARSRGTCFRKRLLEYFGVHGRGTTESFAAWIIRLVFSQKRKALRSRTCCDVCSPARADGLLAWIETGFSRRLR